MNYSVLYFWCVACRWVRAIPGNIKNCLRSIRNTHFDPEDGPPYSSEGLVYIYKSTRYHSSEDHRPNSHSREKLKIYIKCSDCGIWCSHALMNIAFF